MDHIVLIPQFGAGRGRLARHGNAIVYSVADPVASAAFASWCSLVGTRPATEALDDLARLVGRSAVSAVAAFISERGGFEVLTVGDAPITVDGVRLAATSALQRQRVEGLAIELLASGTLADDPLLDFEQGVVAADGFTLRRSSAGPTPWAMGEAPVAAAVIADVDAAQMGGTPAPEAAPAADAAAMAAPANLVSLVGGGDDDLPAAAPLPLAGGAAPSMAPPGTAPAGDDHGTEPVAVTAATSEAGPVKVAGLRCARDHFNDPRARFCATCGIAMHQASFVLTEDVRPPLGVVTFADGTFYSVTGNLVFGRDPDDDATIRAGAASPAILVDPANTISRVHAEIRAIEWDVYLVDRGSTNGTFVWNTAAQQWDRLAPDQPRVIEPGAQMSFGRLVAAFDSGLRP